MTSEPDQLAPAAGGSADRAHRPENAGRRLLEGLARLRPQRRTEGAAPEQTPGSVTRQSAAGQTRSEYRPDIDGIRGAAAIMVVGYHAKVPGFEGAYLGLDLFFVVSGYVICGLLLHEYTRKGSIAWGAFYARRARRLIPAKATMLLGVLVLSYFFATPTGSQQETAKSAMAAAGFVSNIFFLRADDVDYFGHQPGTGVLLHTWSLSVEEQFYLLLPLAILLAYLLARLLRVPVMRSLLFTAVALGAGSVALAIAWASSHPTASYYLPITRAFEFLIGVALALVVRKLRLPQDVREVMGLAGVALVAFILWRPMPVDGYPSYWALIPCTAAVLMTWAGVGGPTVVTRILSVRFLVGLGLVSYGWYLWHWPLLVLGQSVYLAQPPLWARIGLGIAALGIALLSYRYIEGLFYKRSGSSRSSRAPAPPRVILTGVVAMSCVAAMGGVAVAVADHEADSAHWETVSEQLSDRPAMPSSCLGDNYIPEQPTRCDLTPFERDRPTVVLWGDSHAWMYISAIEAAARKRDVNLVAYVMGACPPFLPGEGDNFACARSNQLALDYIERRAGRKQPLRVIMSASWQTYLNDAEGGLSAEGVPAEAAQQYIDKMSQYFASSTPALFERLGQTGVPVDVIGPTPIIPRNAPLCEARTRPFSCDVERSDAIVDEPEVISFIDEQMADLPKGSRYIDPTKALCDTDTCFAVSDGVVNYFDDNHLSAKRSRRLKRFFYPTLRAVARSEQRVQDAP